jgi:hypothetical protein
MLPLALPGGLEILVFLLVFSLPILFVVFIVLLVRDVVGGDGVDPDKVADLEERVATLERKVDEAESGGE